MNMDTLDIGKNKNKRTLKRPWASLAEIHGKIIQVPLNSIQPTETITNLKTTKFIRSLVITVNISTRSILDFSLPFLISFASKFLSFSRLNSIAFLFIDSSSKTPKILSIEFSSRHLLQLHFSITIKKDNIQHVQRKLSELNSIPFTAPASPENKNKSNLSVCLSKAIEKLCENSNTFPAAKEILLLTPSHHFHNTTDIFRAVKRCIDLQIKCAICAISIGTEFFSLFLHRTICLCTQGDFFKVSDRSDFYKVSQVLSLPIKPLLETKRDGLFVGFPEPNNFGLVPCAWYFFYHFIITKSHFKFGDRGHLCAFCCNKMCELPGKCPVCLNYNAAVEDFYLLYSNDDSFTKFKRTRERDDRVVCDGCESENLLLGDDKKCERCGKRFCNECAETMESILKFCVGCND